MQNFSRARRLSALFIALLGFAVCGSLQAQTLSPLMYFSYVSPNGGVTVDSTGTYVYGATGQSSYAAGGLMYRVKTDASTADTIYQYGRLNVWTGLYPGSGLLLIGNDTLYGVTRANSYDPLRGITAGSGTVFKVSTDGQTYTKLYEFDDLTVDSRSYAVNASGAEPQAALVSGMESGVRYLYGTTFRGGQDGTGTIFKVRADGTGFQRLAAFGAARLLADGVTFDTNSDARLKNANGVNPNQRLLVGGDGYLYGATTNGGNYGTGVVFRVSIAGGAIEVLHEFSDITLGSSTTDPTTGVITVVPNSNAEGGYPSSGLTRASNGRIYGTTSALGLNGMGTVYSVAANGSGFALTRSFNTTDGAVPSGDLIVSADGRLVGTTQYGGTLASGQDGVPVGTIYKLSLDGVTLTSQYVFTTADTTGVGGTALANGTNPSTGVVETSDGSLYGVAGGAYGYGVVFKLGMPANNGALGIPPPYDDGSGAISWWFLAALASLIALQMARRTRPQ